MTKAEARRILNLVGGGVLDLAYSAHFQERSRQRVPGFNAARVRAVLRDGAIQGVPVADVRFGNHKVRVRASVAGFGPVEIVVAIAWFDDAVAVTITSIKGR